MVARFLSVEMFVQALGFAAGILLVRQLSKEETPFSPWPSPCRGR